ncbi:MAG: DUF2169 domain-containing protein [Polyangiaceae bacterium]
MSDPSIAIGVVHHRFQPRQDAAVFAVKGCYRLTPGGRATPLDEAEPVTGDTFDGDDPASGACVYASDLVPRKPKADVLVVGKAHAPGGVAVPECGVRVSVGKASLALRVTGDRLWVDDARHTDPKPFTAMSLGFERAFGGPDWAANRAGRGFVVRGAKASGPLPNVEDPAALVKRISDHPAPASFGPLSPFGAHRMSLWPAVTDEWIERGWPWAPATLDYAYFNAAQPALQIDGYLAGDETLVCENMHATERRYACALPGLRARCFVVDRGSDASAPDATRFREVPLVLDTLFADMEAEKLVLVWRGSVPASSRDLAEITHVFVATEPVGGPRLTLDQHRDAFELRRSQEEAALRSDAPDERPVNDNADGKPASAAPAAADAKPKPKPLPPDVKKKLDALGTPPEVMKAAQSGDVDGALAAAHKALGLPAPELERMVKAALATVTAAHVAAGGSADDFAMPAPKPPPPPPPAKEPPADPKAWSRVRVEAALTSNTSLARTNLARLDLSKLDFSGADLTACILEGATLDGAKFDGAKLDEANLAGAKAESATFRGASAKDADLTGLAAPSANFTEANLEGALLDGATLDSAKFDGCVAPNASWKRAELGDATFARVDLRGALFVEAKMDRVVFAGANLEGAIAEGAIGVGVDFTRSSLARFRAGEGAVLPGAKLAGCHAEGSRWMGADLTGADLSRAKLAGSDLSRTVMVDAKLAGADVARADLTGARRGRADLAGANLAHAQLEGADLRRANLKGASLYQANVWLAELGGAELAGAFTAGTLIESPARNAGR